MNKIVKFLKETVLTFIIQYSIGLILPWWVIDIINRSLIEGYDSKFSNYSKLGKWVIGLILPWWILVLLESDKKMSISSTTFSESDSRALSNSKNQKKYYCKFCGHSWNNISDMTGNVCECHPNGSGKGYHQPYEGEEKSKYYCKYCGHSWSSISSMAGNVCQNHPNGSGKGFHEPALN
jgi:hypothetical protein